MSSRRNAPVFVLQSGTIFTLTVMSFLVFGVIATTSYSVGVTAEYGTVFMSEIAPHSYPTPILMFPIPDTVTLARTL